LNDASAKAVVRFSVLRRLSSRPWWKGADVKRRIVIVNGNADGQSRTLAACFRRRGCDTVTVALSSIAFDTRCQTGLSIPGFGGGVPDAVIVRSVAAGSFEAVTRRLGILHALGKLGVPVWNSAAAIERCVDKSMTTFLLHKAGLPTPATFVVEGLDAARQVAEKELAASALVLKPLFGSQGRGIKLLQSPKDLPAEDEMSGVYYLQHYVARPGPPFHDFRVFVCAGKVLAMMARRGDDWITNVNRGASPERISDAGETELAALAVAAAAAVGSDFAGVDIVPAEDGGLMVIEVNSMPAWSGLQSVVQVDIADAIAETLLAFLDDGSRDTERCKAHFLRLSLSANP
jgi:RimK family alpha-L-glutamate ligase